MHWKICNFGSVLKYLVNYLSQNSKDLRGVFLINDVISVRVSTYTLKYLQLHANTIKIKVNYINRVIQKVKQN
jgi:hypothetical protein